MRTKFFFKATALVLAFSILFQCGVPTVAYALTSGPSQPEVQSFTPASVSDMVEPFSGDFTYNIPLFDIDGYPINISYQSGVTMDQEASWVGLGWNLNPGVINRNVRGLPDDFAGETVNKEYNMKPNTTVGVSGSFGAELFGLDNLKFTAGIGANYNNYTGIGFEQTFNVSLSAGSKAFGSNTPSLSLGFTSSKDGLTISPSFSLDEKGGDKHYFDASASYNSRTGLQSFGFKYTPQKLNVGGVHQGSIGMNFSPGVQTYTPKIDMSMTTTSITASFKGGVTLFGLEGTGNLSGYVTSQRLQSRSEKIPAYGYMYSERAGGKRNTLLDFNREKEQNFTENTPALPVTNFTSDILSVAGQGVGGTYRPFRSDIGYVYDTRATNKSNSYSIGFEASGSNLVKIGADIGINLVSGESGAWTRKNDAAARMRFVDKRGSNPLYEPYYFKKLGELTAETEPGRLSSLGDAKATRVQLIPGGGMDVKASAVLITDQNETYNITDSRNKRPRRNEIITVLTQRQAQLFGLSNHIPNPNAKDYHIGAVSTLQPDGSRYIYGIAAYNTTKEEVTFNVGNPNGSLGGVNCNKGLIQYASSQDSRGNNSGIDNYYNRVITPAYAHSYLLTAVLSADYMDVDAIRGPSDGDLGQYKKFNYQRYESKYKWRIPATTEANMANHNEGLKSDLTDDKADYVYGEKELWYLESIESKNYIAIFHTSPRDDAKGVLGPAGGVGTGSASMRKLDKISIYVKSDYKNNPSAVPVKEVYFVYNYSLCGNVPNSISSSGGGRTGKLTLERIYFTNGGSYLSAYNYYKFTYSATNPNYDFKAFDRWGNYKPNTASTCAALSGSFLNSEEPYTEQSANTNTYATAWLLTQVETPSGGIVKITYESDDYAYVQNKRAMQMFRIAGMSSTVPTSASGLPNQLISGSNNNLFLVFPLQEQKSIGSYNLSKFYNDYLEGIDELHFRFMVDITSGNKNYEYVSGYVDLDKTTLPYYGLISNGSDYTHGYIKVKSVPIGDRAGGTQVHPIAKAAWQFGRLSMPAQVWESGDFSDDGPEQVIKAIAASDFFKNIIDFFRGPNGAIKAKGFGNETVLNKSWIRLNNPQRKKKGGGSRVQKILMEDNWSAMTATTEATSVYGQEFTYTTKDLKTGDEISSGVAAYEPQPGGEENPLHKPVWHGDKEQRLLAPDDKFYMEEPFGECFFPSASVGYSEVKIKSSYPTDATVTRHSTGYTIKKFYTAKEYPTISKRTAIDPQKRESDPILKIFSSSHDNYMTASQGYVIELNDMHGKPKSEEIYAVGQKDPISKKEYIYKSEIQQDGTKKLVNTATVIKQDGTTEETTIGLDYDMIADMREQENSTFSTSIGLNLNTFIAFIPIPIPTAFPMISKENVRFRSAVVTKVINRYGLLSETIVTDMGSTISTKNLAYDAETGEVLLTQTVNSYNDPIYSFTYPAHWYYDGMGGAYKNIGATFYNLGVSGGVASYPDAPAYFAVGDKIQCISQNSVSTAAWVSAVNASSVTLINEAGLPFPNATYAAAIIIESGRKNLQINHMGSFVTTINPLPYLRDGNVSGILSAESVEFSDQIFTYCECFKNGGEFTFKSENPFVTGQRGTWYVKRKYTYLTDRTLTLADNSPDMRRDGDFAKFTAFWQYHDSRWNINPANWTWPSEVTIQSPYNVELENQDALLRHKSAVFGYNNSLPTAISANAQYKDIGYDNFEDYDFPTCADDHFSFKLNHKANVTNTDSHTGKRSMKASAHSSNVNMTRIIH
jgi:hypothetical protein